MYFMLDFCLGVALLAISAGIYVAGTTLVGRLGSIVTDWGARSAALSVIFLGGVIAYYAVQTLTP